MSQAQPTSPQATDNVAHALAGAGGGLLSMTLTYPLITLSTRAQIESRRLSESSNPQLPSPPSSPQKRTSTLAAARHILRREGASGLYSGLSSALFGISVTNFVYYYFYEWARAFFLRAAEKAGKVGKMLTTAESMAAGALAGAMTVVITNPIWVVNTRMTAAKRESTTDEEKGTGKGVRKVGTIEAARILLRDEGWKGFFKGVLPALVLVVNPILQYTLFEQMRNMLARRRKVLPWDVFLLGAVGKAVATGVTYPYITVKSRMHVADKAEEGGQGEKGEGIGGSLRRVVREEGWSGLYNGIGPKVSQSVITAAFLFAFKDVLYEASVRARRTVSKKLPVT